MSGFVFGSYLFVSVSYLVRILVAGFLSGVRIGFASGFVSGSYVIRV